MRLLISFNDVFPNFNWYILTFCKENIGEESSFCKNCSRNENSQFKYSNDVQKFY